MLHLAASPYVQHRSHLLAWKRLWQESVSFLTLAVRPVLVGLQLLLLYQPRDHHNDIDLHNVNSYLGIKEVVTFCSTTMCQK